MFGKRKQQSNKGQWQEPKATPPLNGPDAPDEGEAAADPAPQPAAAQPAQPAPAKPAGKPDASKALNRQPAQPGRPDPGRRGGAGRQGGREHADDGRKLLVGRDIALSGEIQSCDQLVVEGHIEADLYDSESLEVTENGTFKGRAVIDTADIAGRYEGELTVRERLYVRATGQVHGTIRYRALEIEGGGRVGGTMVELSDDDVARMRETPTVGDTRPERDASPGAGAAAAPDPAPGEPAASHAAEGAADGEASRPGPGPTATPADAPGDPVASDGASR